MALSSYQAGYELTFEPVRYPNNNPTLGSGTGRNRTFSKFVHYPRKGDVHEHHHACQRMWAPVLIMYIIFFSHPALSDPAQCLDSSVRNYPFPSAHGFPKGVAYLCPIWTIIVAGLRCFRLCCLPWTILYLIHMEFPVMVTTTHTSGPEDWDVCDPIYPSLVVLGGLVVFA
jgi:hypothetical protein